MHATPRDFTGSKNPPTCSSVCPTTAAFATRQPTGSNAKFDHTLYTNYPLTGMHATIALRAVPHQQQLRVNAHGVLLMPQGRLHRSDDSQSRNVPVSPPIALCATPQAAGVHPSFNHSTAVFPLTGAHITVQCALCHVNNNYTTVPTDCDACHPTDYNGTNNPSHATSGFPTTCEVCHNTTDWTQAVFNHNKTTFPLTGAHATVPCAQCHVNNNYTDAADRLLRLPPDGLYRHHQSESRGQPASRPTARFAIRTSAGPHRRSITADGFPLTGAHATTGCAQCHTNNNYTTLPTDCYRLPPGRLERNH